MIDPIQNLPLDRLQAQRPRNETAASRKPSAPPTPPAEARRSDSASFSFNLRGDLESLRNATATVFQEVKQQLERAYAVQFPNQEPPVEGEDPNLPPENASAQELLDFFSPGNTAARIVEFSTGFVEAFLANRDDGDEATEEELDEFTSLLTGAVEQGFQQAEEILGDFEELGEVGDNIKRTFELVMEGLQEFRREYFNDLQLQPEPTPVEEASEELDEPAGS